MSANVDFRFTPPPSVRQPIRQPMTIEGAIIGKENNRQPASTPEPSASTQADRHAVPIPAAANLAAGYGPLGSPTAQLERSPLLGGLVNTFA